MKRFILDAETDGLYGALLTLAVLVTDEDGQVAETFYGGIPEAIAQVKDPWVIENVLPIIGDIETIASESLLLEKAWQMWERFGGEARCYVDVPHPIESRLLGQMVMAQPAERALKGPFPLIDLASLLLGAGLDPLVNRQRLVGEVEGPLHNALYDVYLSNKVLTYLKGKGLDV